MTHERIEAGSPGHSLKPKAILFDLDDTLLDREGSVLRFVQEQHRCFRVSLAHIPGEAYVRRVVELDAHGYVARDGVYRDLAREFALSETLAQELIAHYREEFPSFCQCFPEVPSVLASLRANGMKLGIITNGTVWMQESKLHRLGLLDLVDEVLISQREGLGKPDPKIFLSAVARLGVSASEAWYVGDNPITDIRGAFEAGLTAVWRYTPHWPPPDVPAREIRSAQELVSMLLREG